MDFIETLRKIQAEQVPWVLHNFGERPAEQPLLGIIEEFGELAECYRDPKAPDDDELDALADALIFICDYCSARGWDVGELANGVESMRLSPFSDILLGDALVYCGRLSHAHLKRLQGIRANERHDDAARVAIRNLIAVAYHYLVGTDITSSVWATWEKVRQRDWVAKPNDAHRDA